MGDSAATSDAIMGFKEWAFVCDALVQGRQTLILRKGGIHEGRSGFQFKHPSFFLFPTWFHTQAAQLRWVPAAASQPDYSSDPGYDPATQVFPPEENRQTVDIDGYCTLEGLARVTDWAVVEKLAPFHLWNETVVRERFAYDEDNCLNVALVRCWKLPHRWTFPYSPRYGGCRSWVDLPAEGGPLRSQAQPAMDDDAWQAVAKQVRDLLALP